MESSCCGELKRSHRGTTRPGTWCAVDPKGRVQLVDLIKRQMITTRLANGVSYADLPGLPAGRQDAVVMAADSLIARSFENVVGASSVIWLPPRSSTCRPKRPVEKVPLAILAMGPSPSKLLKKISRQVASQLPVFDNSEERLSSQKVQPPQTSMISLSVCAETACAAIRTPKRLATREIEVVRDIEL